MDDDPDERFPLVDEAGTVVGEARRAECHRDPRLLHPSVHVVVETSTGRLWQLRGAAKDVAPSTWDHACSGHVGVGETPPEAAVRELGEELGLAVGPAALSERGSIVIRLTNETERTTVFVLRHDGPFVLSPPEVAGLAVLPRGERPSPLSPCCAALEAAFDET
jgi:8-oxo-dGTP pyrophosphatase MutT (NUDIX family)